MRIVSVLGFGFIALASVCDFIGLFAYNRYYLKTVKPEDRREFDDLDVVQLYFMMALFGISITFYIIKKIPVVGTITASLIMIFSLIVFLQFVLKSINLSDKFLYKSVFIPIIAPIIAVCIIFIINKSIFATNTTEKNNRILHDRYSEIINTIDQISSLYTSITNKYSSLIANMKNEIKDKYDTVGDLQKQIIDLNLEISRNKEINEIEIEKLELLKNSLEKTNWILIIVSAFIGAIISYILPLFVPKKFRDRISGINKRNEEKFEAPAISR